ncbi:MAG: 50S ribosomal protein L11 methyltransferase, partial [Bacteroidota bacterium]
HSTPLELGSPAAMPSISLPPFASLSKRIQAQYELASQHLQLGGQTIEIQYPSDPDPLLDELIDRGSEDPEVQDERIPYWADVWPSAIGMAQFLAKHPALVQQQQVIELGCGVALPSITGAKLGAGRVIMTDYLPAALEMAAYNWGLNGLPDPELSTLDWRTPETHLQSDVVLASDVIYEARNSDSLLNAFQVLCRPSGTIIWSEPGRPLGESFRQDLLARGFQVSEAKETVLVGASEYLIRIFSVHPPQLA